MKDIGSTPSQNIRALLAWLVPYFASQHTCSVLYIEQIVHLTTKSLVLGCSRCALRILAELTEKLTSRAWFAGKSKALHPTSQNPTMVAFRGTPKGTLNPGKASWESRRTCQARTILSRKLPSGCKTRSSRSLGFQGMGV